MMMKLKSVLPCFQQLIIQIKGMVNVSPDPIYIVYIYGGG